MKKFSDSSAGDALSPFNREFFDPERPITRIGGGSVGGKAQGLAFIHRFLNSELHQDRFPKIAVNIPHLTVLCTDVFDAFMQRNNLYEVAYSGAPDDRIAHAFQKGHLPAEMIGDLRRLIAQVHIPLAIRSSSMLEDAMYEPFAGIYGTKMIPNNQSDTDTRFRKLVEAIKFVYASTYFKAAKDYRQATAHRSEEEKMAVIIQEVVGRRHGERFYPEVSGVARSFNYYPTGRARPEQGVVNLAFGLGKTIVDGGISWVYSPAYPKVNPPYGSVGELLKQTQTEFWAVNMGKPPAYDPIRETEYLLKLHLEDAEDDSTLRYVASTLDSHSGRISIGTGPPGARILTFAPLLVLNELPLNELIKALLELCQNAVGAPVEMEFAMSLKPAARFGFLQVRPMVVSQEEVDIGAEEMHGANVLAASEKALGNGVYEGIRDVVYVRPDRFESRFTPRIAQELEQVNKKLVAEKRPYLLIGFGRWGSSDPWLGVPVEWGQVAGAKAIVEAMLENMNVELSQGSHFFHNLSSFKVSYFSVPHFGGHPIRWEWLEQQAGETELEFVRHVRLPAPLTVKVDGRSGRGVILVREAGNVKRKA